MTALLPIGVGLTIMGLMGLGYCILAAAKARRANEEERIAALQRLVAVNLASVGVAGLGLAVVIVGLVLS